MKSCFRFAAFVVALTAVCGLSTAQFDVNGPNAFLTMQGVVPSTADAADHDVNVSVPGIFNITIDSGVNPLAGIIMLFSFVNPTTGNTFPTPLWGGNIDLGTPGNTLSIQVIADGISFSINPTIDQFYRTTAPTVLQPASTFTQAYTASQFLCGSRGAWQAIVQDATNPPIFIDNTECGDANFNAGQDFILLTGDDGTVNVPFISGNSFPLHGIYYTDVYVVGNGYMCFGSFSSVSAAGFTVDCNSWVNAEPSIAVCLTDWGLNWTGPVDGVFYQEVGSTLYISWGDTRGLTSGAPGMAHYFDSDVNKIESFLELEVDPNVNICASANPNAGTFTLGWPLFDQNTLTRPGDGLYGHTPGGAALAGIPASTCLEEAPAVSGTGVAQMEEHNNTGFNASTIGWDGAGSARTYNEFRNHMNNSVTFNPVTNVIPGDGGYFSVPLNLPADDVDDANLTQLQSTGGENLLITGKFFGFNPGTVTVTDSAAVTLPLVVNGIISGTGPTFQNEVLDTTTPPGMAGGLATITVNFGSGYVESFQIFVLSPCQQLTSFTLGDDQAANVPLVSASITIYGSTFTDIWVGSNGTTSFGAGVAAYFAQLPDWFDGAFAGIGTELVSWGLCDMNDTFFAASATYTVIEDTCTGQVYVEAANQNYWNSIAPAGTVSLTFGTLGAGTVEFNYTAAIDDAGGADNAIVGYGTGDSTLGLNTDFATLGGIENNVPGYASASAPDSAGEDMFTGNWITRLQTINGTGIFTWIEIGGSLLIL